MTINSETDLEDLIDKGESKTLEFKAHMPTDHTLAMIISAFGNTVGGRLVIGVGDKGNIIGIPQQLQKLGLARIPSLTEQLLQTPGLVVPVSYKGKRLIYAEIPEAPAELKPIMTAQGEIFIRVGNQIRKNYLAENLAIQSKPADPVTKATKAMKIFVAMSFREEQEPALVDYFAAMKRAVKTTGLPITLVRIDLVEGDYEISQKVMDQIRACDALLADFTLSPQNVYFEIGFARGRQIPIIQTARQNTALEFDVRNWRTLFYKNATELEEKLEAGIREAYRSFSETSTKADSH
jgi:hypothetical protein